MSVRELIATLQQLPEEQKDLPAIVFDSPLNVVEVSGTTASSCEFEVAGSPDLRIRNREYGSVILIH